MSDEFKVEIEKEVNIDPKILDRIIEDAIDIATIAIQAKSKELCPVDTGNLRSSIVRETNMASREGTVGTNTFYAPYIEFGTSRTQPQPFLRPGMDLSLRPLRQAWQQIINRVLREMVK